jgi:hypothetical protein
MMITKIICGCPFSGNSCSLFAAVPSPHDASAAASPLGTTSSSSAAATATTTTLNSSSSHGDTVAAAAPAAEAAPVAFWRIRDAPSTTAENISSSVISPAAAAASSHPDQYLNNRHLGSTPFGSLLMATNGSRAPSTAAISSSSETDKNSIRHRRQQG